MGLLAAACGLLLLSACARLTGQVAAGNAFQARMGNVAVVVSSRVPPPDVPAPGGKGGIQVGMNRVSASLAQANLPHLLMRSALKSGKFRFHRAPIALAGEPSPEHRGYVAALKAGVDTVLELSVTRLGIRWERGDPAPFSVRMTVQSRLVEPLNGMAIIEHEFTYEGLARPAEAWLADDGKALKGEMAHAANWVAAQSWSALFQPRIRTGNPFG